MTDYHVRHSTRYEYEVPVDHAHHLAHLRPRNLAYQVVHDTHVEWSPSPKHAERYADYFSNDCDTVEILDRHDCLEVTATSRVSVTPRELSTQLPLSSLSWNAARDAISDDATNVEAHEYRCDSPLVRSHALFRDFASGIFSPNRPLVEAVIELNQKIHHDFRYDPSATDVSTPLAQVMRQRKGVCQDFAHVVIACLRSFGLAASYLSGYLETEPPAGKPRLVGADASHAWASVLIPGHGWLEIDPTNGSLPSDRHITLAWGRDFSDVTPLKGVVLGGGKHRVVVGVDVIPLG